MDNHEKLIEQGSGNETPRLDSMPTGKNSSGDVSSVTMEDLLDGESLGLDFPKQGEIRFGTIAAISENEILVSVGTKSEGVISGRELDQIDADDRTSFDVGQEIPVYVVQPEDSNGNVVLSYTRAKEVKDWERVEQLLENQDTLDGKIIGFNKGGLIVPIGRLRGFVPSSQVGLLRRVSSVGDTPEERWGEMVGEKIQVRVIEVDRERRRLILSERLALQESRDVLKDRLLEDLNEGDVRTGRVTSLADFGAFVNIDGADGLVHLSEISWERIQHPNEVLEVGQEVDVKVISIDQEKKRIGLSIRQLQDDPWVKQVSHLKEGSLVEGTITHLTKFGAFARIDDELEGLVHVSELSEQRVAHPKEVVREGQVYTLRVIKIDTERRRIGLSLRKVDSPKYADFDWKMALAEEVEQVQDGEQVVEFLDEDVVQAIETQVTDQVETSLVEVEAEISESVPVVEEQVLLDETEEQALSGDDEPVEQNDTTPTESDEAEE